MGGHPVAVAELAAASFEPIFGPVLGPAIVGRNHNWAGQLLGKCGPAPHMAGASAHTRLGNCVPC